MSRRRSVEETRHRHIGQTIVSLLALNQLFDGGREREPVHMDRHETRKMLLNNTFAGTLTSQDLIPVVAHQVVSGLSSSVWYLLGCRSE